MQYSTLMKTAVISTLLIGSFSNALAYSKPRPRKVCGVYGDLLLGYGRSEVCGDYHYYDTTREGLIGTLNLGYQFNRNFALEVAGGYTLRLAGKFILPIDNCNELYAKVGPGLAFVSYKSRYTYNDAYGTHTVTSDDSYEARGVGFVGAGGTHWFSPRWGMTGEVIYSANSLDSSNDSVNALEATLGVSLHF